MADINVAQAISLAADAVVYSERPPPQAPTGYYDWEVSSNTDDARKGHSFVSNLISEVESLKSKGPIKPDPKVVAAFLDSVNHPTAINDRDGLFGDGLGILARIDPDTSLAKKLNDSVINTLYNTIPHPPQSFVGPKYRFRQADGGGNNIENQDLGRAGTPYARSVQGTAGLPASSLPDPGLIFDTILKRNGQQVNHSGGMSSLIFAFASIITHSIFRTDTTNMFINNASSYLDLSPVYGDNQAAQDKVRDKAQGQERLLFLPPAASALLVVFSRNHNHIAEMILKINEWKRWALQDEEIFQVARLVNGGHFMSCITGDYAAGCAWNMKPFELIDTPDLKVERGQGNHVSVEFSILYRWHATVSEADEKWTNALFNDTFNGKPFDQLTMADLGTIAQVIANVPEDPKVRTFGGLTRGPDGKFSDDKLAEIIHTATQNPASAFRGRGTPPVLRLVEIMGIQQARAWGLCTMNEFRSYLGLKQFESFEEWNPDPVIAVCVPSIVSFQVLIELFIERCTPVDMPVVDGLRFACGYTTTRAVLGDAISLVRGDRFYTSDMTPANLTTWGYLDCQRDMNNGGMGGQIPKLLMRALPRHFPWNSVYSLFSPLNRQGIASKYAFDPPATIPVAKVLNTFAGIKTVFNDPTSFKTIYEKVGSGSMLMNDTPQHDKDKAWVMHSLFPDKKALNDHSAFFVSVIKSKLNEKVWGYEGLPGKFVDIVKDVVYPAAAHVAAEKLTGVPLKTKDNPKGIFTELELFEMLATLVPYNHPEESFALHEAASKAGTVIAGLAAKSVLEVSPAASPNLLGRVALNVSSFIWPPTNKPWYAFLQRLTESGRSLDDIIGQIMGLAVGASVNHGHATVNVIDFYLDDERKAERDQIVQLIQHNDAECDALLLGYVNEAMRLRPQYEGLWRQATVDAAINQGQGLPPVKLKAGDLVFASFRNAHLNPVDFPDPTKVNPRRPASAWANLNGTGFHVCPGLNYAQKSIVDVLKVVFSLKNVRRVAGDPGTLKRFSEVFNETVADTFVQRNGTVGPWPGSMIITDFGL
ncbi:heme peroxidase [Gymnopilus junonius]|uniref:Heme peroxidase n=1 Tax=Gymnopilus junonius TaxID=109634 RepID=A0A9P5NQ96_GYMJU|nr:heme peroxidase [Gymnopilus junonius]